LLRAAQKLWRHGLDLLPLEGFFFDRPLVLLQSDDWGRAGLRDQQGLDRLRAEGLAMGERPYDLYTLETAEDLARLQVLLNRHPDSTGRTACLGMNFIVANLDLAKMEAGDFRQVHLWPLADGLPNGWSRPGLLGAYRDGIKDNSFYPQLHGMTHFCSAAVERELLATGDRTSLLRTMWQAGTPYIHWRMPWIGYEYWDSQMPCDERFLDARSQQELIGQAVGLFSKLFSTLPQSGCAPGYRANDHTHRAWAQYGIGVAQNGPGTFTPPHFDRQGILNLYRNVEFEPATDPRFSVETCVHSAQACFERSIPAIVSMHSINFHSSVSGFRERTLGLLDDFLSALESRHPDLLYLCDNELLQLIEKGSCHTPHGNMEINVTRKKFTRRNVERRVGQRQKTG